MLVGAVAWRGGAEEEKGNEVTVRAWVGNRVSQKTNYAEEEEKDPGGEELDLEEKRAGGGRREAGTGVGAEADAGVEKGEGRARGGAWDQAEAEDPFEMLDLELEQGPWDPWVVECDGFGGGMELGLVDGGVGTGKGFEVLAQQVDHVEYREEVRLGEAGGQGVWTEKEEGGIEELGTWELEAIRRTGKMGSRPRGPRTYAWDVVDFEREGLVMDGELQVDRGVGAGVDKGDAGEGPQRMDSSVVWEQLQKQAQLEALV